MPAQRYSRNEAVERIYRTFRGDTLNETPTTLPGERYSVDEAWSRLAELLQGSLPGENAYLPNAVSMQYGQVYAEPSTGTSTSLITGTWTQLAVFESDGLSSNGVTPDQANDQITLTIAGVYFVNFGVSLEAPNGTATAYHLEVALDGVRQSQVSSKRALNSSGAIIGSMSASGIVQATAGQNLTLEALTEDANRVLHTHEVQLSAIKVG